MKKYLLLIIMAVLAVNFLQAQVTVGADEPPADFSILQLEGTSGGLRLPQVPENNRDNIDLSSPSAKGLMIHNTNTGWINYWNGTSWLPTPEELKARNGLSLSGKTVKLGGPLTRNTTINLNGNNLNFVADASTFRVNTDVMQVNSNNIVLQPSEFSVNTNVFSIAGNAISMLPYSTASGKLTVTSDPGNNKLTVNNRNVIQEGKMTYIDGKQKDGHVLVASATGDAYWAKLRPNTRIVTGSLLSSTTTITGATTPASPTVKDITATTLDLTPGKWLIFANYSTTSTAAEGYNRYYVWTYLYKKPQGASASEEAFVTMTGTPVSINSANRRALPQLMYMVEVTENTSFILKCGTRNLYTSFSTTLGNANFHAISVVEAGQ